MRALQILAGFIGLIFFALQIHISRFIIHLFHEYELYVGQIKDKLTFVLRSLEKKSFFSGDHAM